MQKQVSENSSKDDIVKSGQQKLNEKWGNDTIKAGWTAVPSVLLEYQKHLGLTSTDLAIILHLLKHWWDSHRSPYPGKRRICEAMGITESTMRKRVAKLQKKGLIKRAPKYLPGTKGTMSNEYNLDGLVTALSKLAQDVLKERQKRENNESVKRRKRAA